MDRRKIGFEGIAGCTCGHIYISTHVTSQIFRYPKKLTRKRNWIS